MQVESIRSTSAEREAELTSKLEDHEQKARDRSLLDEQVIQIQKDLQLARATIVELVSFAMCFEFFFFFFFSHQRVAHVLFFFGTCF